jgi:spermidine synthase
VIGIDAYRPPYIPWQLTTLEFFQEVKSHLAWDGVVVINVGRTDTDRRLVEALTATMLQVFPSVHTMDVPDSFNSVLVATNQPTSDSNLTLNTAWLSRNATLQPFLKLVLDQALGTVRPTVASSLVFTDDRAPVELIADTTVLGFMLEKNQGSPNLFTVPTASP